MDYATGHLAAELKFESRSSATVRLMKADSTMCMRVAQHLASLEGHGRLVAPAEADSNERTRGAPQGQKFVDFISSTESGVAIAMEHTQIESYEMQLHDARQIMAIIAPLGDQIVGLLPRDRSYALAISIGAVRDETLVPEEVQAALLAWIVASAPHIPAGGPWVAPMHQVHGGPPVVPVEVILSAWRPTGPAAEPGRLHISQFRDDEETMRAMRVVRLRRALNDKLPKLLAQAPAQTTLVLEDQDGSTSNIYEDVIGLKEAAKGLTLCDTIVVVETTAPGESTGVIVYADGEWIEDVNATRFPMLLVRSVGMPPTADRIETEAQNWRKPTQ